MKVKADEIEKIRQKQIEQIKAEVREFGDFKTQYKRLKTFRNELRKFYKYSFFDKLFIPKLSKISTGDLLDHHSVAYFAPFDFKRASWNLGGGG